MSGDYHGYGWAHRLQPADEYVVPDRIGEVLGWRGWRYRPHSGYLTSVHMDHHNWAPRQILQAQCMKMRSCDTPPRSDHSCGFYALKELDIDYLVSEGYLGHAEIWGIVGLSGKIIEGTRGYRAERARPIHLWVSDVFAKDIVNTQLLGAIYDVPVYVMTINGGMPVLPGALEVFEELQRKGVYIRGDRRDDQGVHD